MLFWNSLTFLMIQQMLAIWFLVPLPFLKPAWTSGSSRFTYCWSLAWRILSITLLACEMSAIVWQFEHSLPLPLFGFGMKTDLFLSYGHCWVFQISWHMECSTFTASSFRIWNSSTEIPSPPLALFVVMLSKTQLTHMGFLAFLMMYSAYKLNKQGDNKQPWHTPFPIWNQSVFPYPVLTVASWPAYRFLRQQLRWSGIPISFRIFHSLLWST